MRPDYALRSCQRHWDHLRQGAYQRSGWKRGQWQPGIAQAVS